MTHSQVVAELVKRGVPQHVAEGVAMNFRDESNFNTSIRGDAGNSLGLAQWNGPRLARLRDFASTQGRPIDDPNVQLDFFMHENATNERGAWSQVLNSSSPQEAAVKFVNLWERPAEKHAIARSAKYRGASGEASYSPAPTNPNVGSTIDFKRAETEAETGQPAGTPRAFPDISITADTPSPFELTSGGKTRDKNWLELMAEGGAAGAKAMGNVRANRPNYAQPAAAIAPAEQPMAPVVPVGGIDPQRRAALAQLMAQLNSGRLFG